MIKNKPTEYERNKREQHEKFVFTMADKITKGRLWAKVVQLEKTGK